MIVVFIISFALSVILILINSLIAKKSFFSRETPSPFECGFEPKSTARVPFSLRFYLIALIFLVFDVEITLILPLPVFSAFMNNIILTFLLVFFVVILLLGTFHEWNEGALEWDK